MKLRHLRARNVLSFGDEDIELKFGPFNIIAGPNDSGKTNLFRALSLIEEAFDYRKLSLDGILFQGDTNKALHFEVGVELDITEIDLLATLIICSEISRVERPDAVAQGIKEKLWKNILKTYGYQILTKSFRHVSFLLVKDELITSEPNMFLEIADKSERIYMNRNGYISETGEDRSSFQQVSLAGLILDDFISRYGNGEDVEINALLKNESMLVKGCPSLTELIIGKLEGDPNKIVDLRIQDFNQLRNDLRDDPFLAKLVHLCQQRKIDLQNLYPWNILQKMYGTSFVRLQELRVSPPSFISSSTSQDSRESTILGNELALRLFLLKNSGTRNDRVRYNKIKNEFENLTESEFDVGIRTRDVTELSEGELGVLIPQEAKRRYSNQAEFVALGFGKESKARFMNEAYVQVIKHNYPIAIEKTASGLYEILFLLTTIIGENGKILLLDEPELHLHPTMQKRILNLLSESKVQSGNQIVMITHSPYLVSKEEIDTTWRFSKTESGTKAHNLGRVFLELESQEQQKLTMNLSSPIIRSLLFSRGVIFVEGLSDKIVVEQVDRYLSNKNKGANIDENEWSIIDIGGKKSLSKFIILSRMMGIPNVAVMDYDALMCKDSKIKLNEREVKTSSIVYSLFCTGSMSKGLISKVSSPNVLESEWYDLSQLEELRALCNENHIFVFSTDLEGVIQSQVTRKTQKPLKALQRIIKLIDRDNIHSEFYEMCKFLKNYTSV